MNFTEAYRPSGTNSKTHATTIDGLVACGIGGYRYVDTSWGYFGRWHDTFPYERCKNCEKATNGK